MANESLATVTSLVNTSSGSREISVTRIRDVEVKTMESNVNAVESMANAKAAVAEQVKVSREAVQKVVSELKAYVQSTQRNLDFQVDDKTGRVVVKVIDATNDQVIRQIPSEEMIAISRRIQDYLDENQVDMIGILLEIKA